MDQPVGLPETSPRVSVGLTATEYRDLRELTGYLAVAAGVTRVTHVAVFRALLAELKTDHTLQARIVDRLVTYRTDPVGKEE